MSIKQSLSILGLKKIPSLKELKALYRSKAKEHHPDNGGDKEMFLLIKDSYEEIKNFIDKESELTIKCHLCEGKPKSGFFCYHCNGNGSTRSIKKDEFGRPIIKRIYCSKCNGLGSKMSKCNLCDDKGVVSRKDFENYILSFNI